MIIYKNTNFTIINKLTESINIILQFFNKKSHFTAYLRKSLLGSHDYRVYIRRYGYAAIWFKV